MAAHDFLNLYKLQFYADSKAGLYRNKLFTFNCSDYEAVRKLLNEFDKENKYRAIFLNRRMAFKDFTFVKSAKFDMKTGKWIADKVIKYDANGKVLDVGLPSEFKELESSF